MEILSEEQQIRNRINEVNSLIDYQKRKVDKASKRYGAKLDFGILSFWVRDNTSTLKYIWEQERGVLKALREYEKQLTDRL